MNNAMRRVHIKAREGDRRLGVSICGRFEAETGETPWMRSRHTSAVTCRWCVARWKRGIATPPARKGAAA